MKKLVKPMRLVSIIILFILVISGCSYVKYKKAIDSPLIAKGPTIEIVVNEGETLYGLLERLKREGVLRNYYISKYYIKKHNLGAEIKPGTYDVSIDTSLEKFISILKQGGYSVKLTIPEGFSVEDIATKVEKTGLVTKKEFLYALRKYPIPRFVKDDNKKRYNLEGYLFPDTYTFQKNAKADDIILAMITRFNQVMKDVQIETGREIKEKDYERILTVASIIEKEARVEKDRTLISSVIENRLKSNMMLQIDATVIYSLGQHKDVVTYKDLEVKSPYNTYKNKGLPIGPICNPGKLSILAAIKPDNTNYLYYVLKKDNSHYFTATYKDFLIKKKEFGY
ncbi:cell division protein YceG [Clostridium polyendosporum]|uniref:Endolytic murein transglycosylase n=1 Tax=Clostridium polyendosporum TaxID=69208 RepID=A0A919RY71_9CLOT|nr:endolytic transglycosylase MltG [Clostridium polyendosporum]GIM27911.1 cell division protein YceG [Clostridium polyendosporum]